jgi:putative ABC transport system ATP-binding protein
MPVLVNASKVVKDFPAGDEMVRVLFDINLKIHFGQLTMLVGPSGCGKTTLISLLTGILSVSEGEIEILNQKITSFSDREKVFFRRQNVGFIFQQFNLLQSLTAAENTAMPLISQGVPFKEAVSKAKKILEMTGIADHVDKLPKHLSGGQQQRVAIARALVHEPKFIVCDEPTASLDAKSGNNVMQILRDISNHQERAVLVVTHDNRIFHFADRIIEMTDGRIIGDYNQEEFMQRDQK